MVILNIRKQKRNLHEAAFKLRVIPFAEETDKCAPVTGLQKINFGLEQE